MNIPENAFQILWNNPQAAQRVIHLLLGGKHIDAFLAEDYRFLENFPTVWEEFFRWMGYELRKSEIGSSPFFYLDPITEHAVQARLSRGATFLGLYLAWYFFMQGPGEMDTVLPDEIFRRLTSSYPFPLLRSIFFRRAVGGSPVEMSEDQADRLRAGIRKELSELARYRFIEIKPSIRSSWEDLTIHRLPALYRFWELALHIRSNGLADDSLDMDRIVAQVWGNMEGDMEEDDL